MTEAQIPLKILHVFRAPLGGLFRHVADLVRGQIARGHKVGIIAESTTHGDYPEGILKELSSGLQLGLTRTAIPREIGPTDLSALLHVRHRIAACAPDVVHGHGAKGGAYARLATGRHHAVRAYTPHGGSLLYRPGSLASYFYLGLERLLRPRTDLFLFESAFIGDVYAAKVGLPPDRSIVRVVHNGIGAKEIVDVVPSPQAVDILFIGELRPIKGVDTLLESLAILRQTGLTLRAVIVGNGRAKPDLQAQAQALGLNEVVTFRPPMPARDAFALGHLAVVPSRGESLPYIVLEIAGAALPLITTRVGGNPEIFGPQADLLLPPDDPAALAAAIAHAVKNPESMRENALVLRERIRAFFSVEDMVDRVIAAYRDAMRLKSR
jgi:glycosyltransferase involved in cell wall biosynthesis